MEMTRIVSGSNLVFVPSKDLIAVDGTRISYRLADGSINVLSNAHIVGTEKSAEIYVRPGQAVPRQIDPNTKPEIIP